jgi:hypothetical protein
MSSSCIVDFLCSFHIFMMKMRFLINLLVICHELQTVSVEPIPHYSCRFPSLSMIQVLSILPVSSLTLVVELPNISQLICHQLISNRNIIQLSLYQCFRNITFVVNVVLLPLCIFMLMASVLNYDSQASCVTLYPLACIQKGIDLLDVISRTCAGLIIAFIADAGTLWTLACDILCNIWSNHPRSSANNNCYFLNADWLSLSYL